MPTKNLTMATNKNFLTVAISILCALFLSSCEADAWLELEKNPTPQPQEYTIATEHVSASYADGMILDKHIALLKEDNKVVENHNYTAKHSVVINKVAVKRSLAETLVGKTIAYTDGFNLNGAATLTVSIALENCESVYFEENGKTYCHKNFLKDGAIAALTACNWTPSILRIGEINGNILNGKVIVKDHESIEIPVEIAISEDDVRTVEYSDATVKTSTTVEIIKTVKVNGNITETTPITVAIAAGLECGEMIETSNLASLAYGSAATVANGTATVSMNIVSFTASVTMPTSVQFSDEGSTHTAQVVWKNLVVTSNGSIKVDKKNSENIDIMNTAYFKLVCDGIDMATDTKQVHQTKRIYAEFEKEENGNVTFILHGEKDIRFTAPSGISLVAGADQSKIVDNLELKTNGKTEGSWVATGTKSLNGVKYTSYRRIDSYSYSNGINNTVTMTKNDNYVIVYKGHEYPVSMSDVVVSATAPVKGNVNVANGYKSCAFSLNYTASRNNTSASDETVVTLKKKVADYIIAGYRLVRADQTDRYDTNRDRWESTPICAWFESITDSHNTLFVAFDETTGAEIYRENTSGKSIPQGMRLAMKHAGGNAFVAGYVLIDPNVYTYYAFDGTYTAVSAISSTTARLRDPYQGSGVYDKDDQSTSFALANGRTLVLK